MNHTTKNYSLAFQEHGIHNRLGEHQGAPESSRQYRREQGHGRRHNLSQVGRIEFLANAARDRISQQNSLAAKIF